MSKYEYTVISFLLQGKTNFLGEIMLIFTYITAILIIKTYIRD